MLRSKEKRTKWGVLLLSGIILLVFMPVSAICSLTSEFDVIADAASTYLSAGKPANISSEDLLYDMLDVVPDDPFVLSIRASTIYAEGHIPGAVNIPMAEVFKPENLRKLPKDRQIVVYCYTGHTGSRVAALLSLADFDAVNLKWGMTGWTKNTKVAPRRFDPEKTPMDYPFETSVNLPTEIFPFPSVDNTSSSLQEEIIRAACYDYTSTEHPDISAKELYELLTDADLTNDPFIVSVRSPEIYAKGHIPGAINIPWREIAKKANLEKLPSDRKIVLYCYTGRTASQAAAILGALGYNVANLHWGMTSWTKNKDVAPSGFNPATSMDYQFESSSS